MNYIFKLKCEHCERIFYTLDSLDKHNNDCNTKVTKTIDFPPSPDNISVKIFVTSNCSCITCLKFGFHAATAIHEPSGESNEVVLIIRELSNHALAYELLESPSITAVRGLREKMEIKAR